MNLFQAKHLCQKCFAHAPTRLFPQPARRQHGMTALRGDVFSLAGVQTKKVRGEAPRQCTSITGQLRGPPQSSGTAARPIKSARTQVISVSYPISGACPQDVSHPKLQALQAVVVGEVLRYVCANRGGSSGLGLALLDTPARFFSLSRGISGRWRSCQHFFLLFLSFFFPPCGAR